MRKYLLPKEGTFYKANLHSHTTLSDGNLTPEQMRDEYKKRGYSILATSDHDVLHCNYELTQEDFLMLTAYEISIRSDDDPTPHAFRPVVDLNLIAKEPYNKTQIGFHPETTTHWIKKGRITQEFADNIKYAGELRDMHYYPENINKIIKSANENGWLVCINHPTWSLAHYDHTKFEGAWAMEIYNHGCYALSGLPDAEVVFDDMLRSGKDIFCVASDDNHNSFPLDSYKSDSFGGFTMIKSKSLDYESIIAAMENGDFYASTGPQIKELYYEDGVVHIECSPAAEILLTTLGRRGERIASDDGSPVCSADFRIDKELYGYIRLKVVDMHGKKAYTNFFRVCELDD